MHLLAGTCLIGVQAHEQTDADDIFETDRWDTGRFFEIPGFPPRDRGVLSRTIRRQARLGPA
jgi:hypothetical protein